MSAATPASTPKRLPADAPARQNRPFSVQESQVERAAQRIEAALEERFGTPMPVAPALPGLEELQHIVEHRSHRKYSDKPVEPSLLRLLFACALSAPSKSD